MSFIIGAALFSIFPIMFLIEDAEGCGIYDPSSVHPPHRSLRERLQERLKRLRRP